LSSVTRSFFQIENYGDYLKAIITKSPTALKVAQQLDEEREKGYTRGPLHGIPILIKVRNSILELLANIRAK